jgi:hypothetical protein
MHTAETAKYAVKDGQIFYVQLSKPCTVSDPDDLYDKIDITPYTNNRMLSYGVFVDDPDGYSSSAHTIRKITLANIDYAKERFAVWCNRFGCNLTWEDATKIAGWQ